MPLGIIRGQQQFSSFGEQFQPVVLSPQLLFRNLALGEVDHRAQDPHQTSLFAFVAKISSAAHEYPANFAVGATNAAFDLDIVRHFRHRGPAAARARTLSTIFGYDQFEDALRRERRHHHRDHKF